MHVLSILVKKKRLDRCYPRRCVLGVLMLFSWSLWHKFAAFHSYKLRWYTHTLPLHWWAYHCGSVSQLHIKCLTKHFALHAMCILTLDLRFIITIKHLAPNETIRTRCHKINWYVTLLYILSWHFNHFVICVNQTSVICWLTYFDVYKSQKEVHISIRTLRMLKVNLTLKKLWFSLRCSLPCLGI